MNTATFFHFFKARQFAFVVLMVCLGLDLSRHSLIAAIYQENFNNTSGASASVTTIGWNCYIGATATNSNAQTTCTLLSTGTSNPSTDGPGYFGFIGAASYPAGIGTVGLITTFSAIDIGGSTITWNMGNSTTTATVQILVQISGNWYVSNQTFTNSTAVTTFSTATAANVSKSLTFSTAAADWSSFTLTSGSTMAVGSTLGSDLASTQITGIGFYISNSVNQTVRLDTLAVNVVPEPSGVWLLGLGILFFGVCYRARMIKTEASI